MPGRSYTAGTGYRYGFNGKENDNEVKGTGNQQDYGMRIYDPRIGKFLSIDPLTSDYPWYSTYQFAGNKPIQYVDLDGAEETIYGLAKEGFFGKTGSKIVIGTIDGVNASLSRAWSFISSDIWKAKTWKETTQALGTVADITFGNLDGGNNQLAYNVIQPKVDNFKKEVTNGDAYSRSKYFSEAGTDLLLAYATDKGLGALKNLKWSARLTEGTQAAGISFSKGASNLIKKVSDFKLGHTEGAIVKSSDYGVIKNLSDKDLIESVLHPKDYKKVTVNTETGTLADGNTRIYELQRRGLNIDVPYNEYTPDRSMFPELKEPPKK